MTKRIIVVGGGVVGCSVAWHLAARGHGDVVLIERDVLGSGTTWHSAGNITWKPIADNDAPVLYMLEVIQRLAEDYGAETGWHRMGRLFLARDAAALADFAAMDETAQARGIETRLLAPSEAADLHPLLKADTVAGAWFNPMSGRVNPADLTAAYARAAKRDGARIVENCRVTEVVADDGRVAAVETSEGRQAADAVVVCGGLWSRPLLARLGVALPQLGCEHFYVIAQPEDRLARDTPSFICPENLIYGREEVGGFLVGCFDEDAKVIDDGALPDPFAFTLLNEDWDKVLPYFEHAMALFPALETAAVKSFVNGPEAFTPDGNPLIGPVDGIDGLYVCAGMNSRGVTWSAAAGHIVADLLADRPPRFDAAGYAPDRFGELASDDNWLGSEVARSPSRHYRAVN